jgi:hypothetical protein
MLRQTAVALLALAAPGAHPGGTLTGTVTRGPIAPVCVAGRPCDAPARRIVLLFGHGGATVRTRTDGAGHYTVTLAAATWRVSLDRTGVGTSISPATVRVVAGRTRRVDLSIDTGIR